MSFLHYTCALLLNEVWTQCHCCNPPIVVLMITKSQKSNSRLIFYSFIVCPTHYCFFQHYILSFAKYEMICYHFCSLPLFIFVPSTKFNYLFAFSSDLYSTLCIYVIPFMFLFQMFDLAFNRSGEVCSSTVI